MKGTIITRNGCACTVFRTQANGWCVRVGANVYFGYASKKAAVKALNGDIL